MERTADRRGSTFENDFYTSNPSDARLRPPSLISFSLGLTARAMEPKSLLQFLRQRRLAVQSSVSALNHAQAAVVGFAVSEAFEIIFDTLDSTRKVANLRANPRIALVIGGLDAGDERTVQYEGIADEPSGGELERLTEIYYQVYPDGRTRRSWPGLIYIRVQPIWIRYSDYNHDPPQITEFDAQALLPA